MSHLSSDFSVYLARVVEAAANTLMDAEVSALLNAAPYERSGERLAYRNGYRARSWQAVEGVRLHIPKLRSGSYYPAFLERPNAPMLFEQLAQGALCSTLNAQDVAPLLSQPNPEIAAQVATIFNEHAADYRRAQRRMAAQAHPPLLALGLPLARSRSDNARAPRALLVFPLADSRRPAQPISTEALETLRRLAQHPQDAIGLPLRRVA